MLRIDKTITTAFLAATLSLTASTADAGVLVVGTRVVYPAEQREVSVRLENSGPTASLVQAWIDDGQERSSAESASHVPFMIRPPIFRIDEGRKQVLRILHTGEPMAQDRESLYYLNILDVPAKEAAESDGTKLRMVVRSQLKLFYRPKGLSATGASKAAAQLQWTASKDAKGWALQVANPTPYHVSVSTVVAGDAVKVDVAAPLTTTTYRLTQTQYNALGAQVQFTYITDLGAILNASAPLARS